MVLISVGLGLLNCLLSGGGSFSILDEKGIGRASFSGEEIKAYDYIKRHFIRHGVFPDGHTVGVETGVRFPSFPDEPMSYWIERVEERTHSGLVVTASQQMQEAIAKGDVEKARELVRKLYAQVNTQDVTGQIRQLQALAEQVLDEHDRVQLSSSMSGVPFGIPYLDEISGGAQPADSIAIVGSKGVGKTYFILTTCLSCFASGGVPLLGTFEMSGVQVARRMMALRSHVMAMMIRLGKLSHWARRKLEDDKNWLKAQNLPFPILQGTLKTTVEDIVLRVQELRPTALYIDGAYLLRTKERTTGRVERVTTVAEWLKMIAKDFNIPVFSTYQFARKGRGIESIAWSDATAQLASIVISIRDEDEDEGLTHEGPDRFDTTQEYKILELLKGREGERGKIRITFDMKGMRLEQESILEGYRLEEGGEGGNEGN